MIKFEVEGEVVPRDAHASRALVTPIPQSKLWSTSNA